MREILFYQTEQGGRPVADFLDALDAKTAQKVTWVLKLVEELELIPKQYFKKLEGSDIWEVRVQSGRTEIRILGFWDTGKFVILCHGFFKKSQKTPLNEIRTAEQRKANYFNRKRVK